jgi:hypothetical protein
MIHLTSKKFDSNCLYEEIESEPNLYNIMMFTFAFVYAFCEVCKAIVVFIQLPLQCINTMIELFATRHDLIKQKIRLSY